MRTITTIRKAALAALSLTLATAASLAPDARAGTTFNGIIAVDDCMAGMDAEAMEAELYGFKIKQGGQGYTDILADLSYKVGVAARVGGASIDSSPAWSLPPNWRLSMAPEDVVFSIVTFNDGTVAVNSGSVADTGGDPGFVPNHVVGYGIPASWGVRNARGPVGRVVPGNTGIQLDFAPLPEVTGDAETFGVGCHVGGLHPDPNNGKGLIVGYNVYRVPDSGSTPTPADFLSACTDRNPATGGWVYFASLDSVDLTAALPWMDDLDPNDLVGLINPDATPYTGDDVLVFQDSPDNPDGTPRCCGTAPVMGRRYWYTVQPVVRSPAGETIGDVAGVVLSSAGSWTVTTQDLTMDGVPDAADLDGDGAAEFFSPQADVGIGGLGLTHRFGVGGGPLLCPPALGDWVALPAVEGLGLTGVRDGSRVRLTLVTRFEEARVLGFRLLRVQGAARLPVDDAPIMARGGEGSVYEAVDELGSSARRLRGAASLRYLVEILFADGSEPELAGPFAVGDAPPSGQPPGRRAR